MRRVAACNVEKCAILMRPANALLIQGFTGYYVMQVVAVQFADPDCRLRSCTFTVLVFRGVLCNIITVIYYAAPVSSAVKVSRSGQKSGKEVSLAAAGFAPPEHMHVPPLSMVHLAPLPALTPVRCRAVFNNGRCLT